MKEVVKVGGNGSWWGHPRGLAGIIGAERWTGHRSFATCKILAGGERGKQDKGFLNSLRCGGEVGNSPSRVNDVDGTLDGAADVSVRVFPGEFCDGGQVPEA